MDGGARVATAAAFWSLGLHLCLVFALLHLPAAPPSGVDLLSFEVDVEEGADDAARSRPGGPPNERAAVLEPGGRRSVQNVDAQNRGDSGDRTGAEAVILLLPTADPITLQDSPRNSNDGAQTQRIRTANSRATREDRRATPNPGETPFLASGTGVHPERRPVAERDAREGARVAPSPTTAGAAYAITTGTASSRASSTAVGVGVPAERGADAARGGETGEHAQTAGADRASPGRGIADGEGARASESARVARGRPPVDEGPAATNAAHRDPRVRDDQDAELLAAEMVESWVEASRRRGASAGSGRGGVSGGGEPGAGGGEGEGGRASAHGPGRGAHASLDTSDRRYHRWYLALRRRIQSRLAFPRERMLAMDQGLTVYRFEVRRDGRLAGPPRLLRSSGFDDFDLAAASAIEQAAPFAPLPSELARGIERHSVRIAIEHSNPMVQ